MEGGEQPKAEGNSGNMNSTNKEKIWIDLGEGSEVLYIPHFLPSAQSQEWMKYLDQYIPWTRPSLFIFGRTCSQQRETCYVADKSLPAYKYSGYQPVVHSWDDYPQLKEILKAVHEALPGSTFNSLLLNRYKDGGDYVAWHSDNEVLYGPTPTIASVTFGAEREFLMRRKKTAKGFKEERKNMPNKDVDTKEKKRASNNNLEQVQRPRMTLTSSMESSMPPSINKACQSDFSKPANAFQKLKTKQGDAQSKLFKDHHSFVLKHGSLLVMRGHTQRDWEHTVPKRMKVPGLRINLTFRYILES
eukprot:Gb_34540 [translate_table: standard]